MTKAELHGLFNIIVSLEPVLLLLAVLSDGVRNLPGCKKHVSKNIRLVDSSHALTDAPGCWSLSLRFSLRAGDRLSAGGLFPRNKPQEPRRTQQQNMHGHRRRNDENI
jgi:hypothetical protein